MWTILRHNVKAILDSSMAVSSFITCSGNIGLTKGVIGSPGGVQLSFHPTLPSYPPIATSADPDKVEPIWCESTHKRTPSERPHANGNSDRRRRYTPQKSRRIYASVTGTARESRWMEPPLVFPTREDIVSLLESPVRPSLAPLDLLTITLQSSPPRTRRKFICPRQHQRSCGSCARDC